MMAAVLLPSYVEFAQVDPPATVRGKGTDRIAARLSTILDNVDQALERLPGDKLPALKDQLGEISALLDDLVSTLQNSPDAGSDGSTTKEQVVKLDLMLHRLVIILERIAGSDVPTSTPAQGKLHATISDLREWINGYMEGATADTGPLEAGRYEEMARILLSDVGKHVGKIAAQAKPKAAEASPLDAVIKHIKVQLRVLDRFMLRNFPISRGVPRLP